MDVFNTIQLMSDEYSLNILSLTCERPRSIGDLCSEIGLPMASCYRRLEDLIKANLVISFTDESSSGRKMRIYQSQIERMDIQFRNGEMKVMIVDYQGRRMISNVDLNLDVHYNLPFEVSKTNTIWEGKESLRNSPSV